MFVIVPSKKEPKVFDGGCEATVALEVGCTGDESPHVQSRKNILK